MPSLVNGTWIWQIVQKNGKVSPAGERHHLRRQRANGRPIREIQRGK